MEKWKGIKGSVGKENTGKVKEEKKEKWKE